MNATRPYVFTDYMRATEWLKQHGFVFELTLAGEERMGAEMRREDGDRAVIQAARRGSGVQVEVFDKAGVLIDDLPSP